MITCKTVKGILPIFINMRYLILGLWCMLAANVHAQKNEPFAEKVDYKGVCVFSTPKTKLAGNNAYDAEKYLLSYVHNLKADKVGLILKYTTQSPGGMHYSFVQTYAGVEVYQAEVKVNIDRNNIVRSVLDNSFRTNQWNINISTANEKSVIALLPESGEAVLAELRTENAYEQLWYNDEVIFSRDMRSYAGIDSTVTGKVFYPDPLTSAQQSYTSGTFADNNDTNAPWLEALQRTVTFKADYDNGEFKLRNQYVLIQDFDEPDIPIVTASTPIFNYNRSEPGFEDVNVYYHLNTYRSHVDSLGFDMANELIYADPHAVDSQDQSYFIPSQIQPRLYFGQGGVDDAEDADVIVHEYGHFLSYNAAPNTNDNGDRNALDEAFGDYLAYSYSVGLGGTYRRGDVFNWDGHNQYWGGRKVYNNRFYPDSNQVGSYYYKSGIWSATLASIHDEIGRLATDSLIYQAHYSYALGLTMPDAAQLLLEADTVLTGGKYFCPIYKYLVWRGLAPLRANPCSFTGINDSEETLQVLFMQHAGSFSLINHSGEPVRFEILNIAGQQVINPTNVNDEVYTYENNWLPAGMYLVNVRSGNSSKVFKWVK